MRRLPALLASSALIITCLVLIAMQSGSPLLYSPRSDAFADDHVNTAALPRVTGDRSAQVLPLIEDLLNSPGSLVLTIKANDYEGVARELEEYRQVSRNLDRLVINLDMTESELAEFRKANQENLHILTELSNGTHRWEELKTLEIRYRESGDSQMLTSITYEGESLQRKIEDLYRDYLDQEDVMIRTGEKFNADTSTYLQSERDFREVVSQVETGQEERVSAAGNGTATGGMESRLTIDIIDREVSYSEFVQVQGEIFTSHEIRPEEVDLFIDSQKAGSMHMGNNLTLSFKHVVEHERAGTHTVFAVYSGSLFSEIRTFLVKTDPTMLVMEPPAHEGGKVVMMGTLRTDKTPVKNAPVVILSDGKIVSTVSTSQEGSFRVAAKIPPGDHTVKALFEADSYPLYPSESEEFKIFIPEPATPAGEEPGILANPVHIGILAASICVSCVAAFFYLRHRRPGSIPPAPVFHLPEIRPSDEEISEENLPSGSPIEEPDRISSDAIDPGRIEPGRDLTRLFSILRLAASRKLAFLHPGSLTPRELCAKCRDLAIGNAICRFTRGYEQAVYGGSGVTEENREMLLDSYNAAMESLEGIDH
ncbi:MAG: hypothetical protein WC502_02785 [Methanolinea sp.]|jgi:hypothetical protein